MCIFCDIIHHEIPSKVVYEDDQVLASLDIAQVTKGHTLVMPKKHVENLLECDDETAAHLIQVVKKLAVQIKERTGAAAINILNNNGELAGQTVKHLHFHIIPRNSENDAFICEFKESEKQDLDEVLNLIK